jgi:hypothetical protein
VVDLIYETIGMRPRARTAREAVIPASRLQMLGLSVLAVIGGLCSAFALVISLASGAGYTSVIPVLTTATTAISGLVGVAIFNAHQRRQETLAAASTVAMELAEVGRRTVGEAQVYPPVAERLKSLLDQGRVMRTVVAGSHDVLHLRQLDDGIHHVLGLLDPSIADSLGAQPSGTAPQAADRPGQALGRRE